MIFESEETIMTHPNMHLVIRHSRSNPDHHLWNNHGTWWLHFTLKSACGAQKRHRLSLKTRDVAAARKKRDRVLAAIAENSGRISY